MWWTFAIALGGAPDPVTRCADRRAVDPAGASLLRAAIAASYRDARSALDTLDALVPRYPECAAARAVRAGVRHALGDEEGALDDLRAARALDPDAADVRRALAIALHRAGGAGELLDEAILAAPEDGLLEVLRARERPVSERPALLRAAVRAHPTDPDVARAAVDAIAEAGMPLDAVALGRAVLTGLDDPELAARIDEIERPFVGPAPARARRPAEYRPASDASVEVIVYSAEGARRALERRLHELGWTETRVIPGGVRYRSAAPVQPWVDVLDSGEVVVQSSGVVKPAPLPDGSTMIPVISERKLRARRTRLMEEIWFEVTTWRNAISLSAFQSEVDGVLPTRLDRLWADGEPLFGDEPLETLDARRAALLAFWSSRICSADGDVVRGAVERFLRNVVQESAAPVTEAERRSAEEACACPGVALDLEGSAGAR